MISNYAERNLLTETHRKHYVEAKYWTKTLKRKMGIGKCAIKCLKEINFTHSYIFISQVYLLPLFYQIDKLYSIIGESYIFTLILNPRRHWLFRVLPRHRGGGRCWYDPPRVWPLIELEEPDGEADHRSACPSGYIELEFREKNERVGLHNRKPMVPNFKVSGQPMTSEVRSNTRRGPSEMTLRDALKSTVIIKSVLNYAKTLQNTP